MDLQNISQLMKIESSLLKKLVSEIETHPTLAGLWAEPYPEYASAGMQVATLLNPTGEQQNFDYRDCRTLKPTPLLESMPVMQSLFFEKGMPLADMEVMGARLLKLEPGTFYHEHRDFVYLEAVPRFRLHIPLITNDQSFIVGPDTNVHFQAGYLWKLDPKNTIHSACNFGESARIHLMIDCYVNEKLQTLLDNEKLDETLKVEKAPLTSQIKESLIEKSIQLMQSGSQKQAEELILGSFCHYNLYHLQEGLTTYDILKEAYKRAAEKTPSLKTELEEKFQYWKDRLIETYPERKDRELAPV